MQWDAERGGKVWDRLGFVDGVWLIGRGIR